MSSKDVLWGLPGYNWDWTAGWLVGLGMASALSTFVIQFVVPNHPHWVSAVLLAAGVALSVIRALQLWKMKREAATSN